MDLHAFADSPYFDVSEADGSGRSGQPFARLFAHQQLRLLLLVQALEARGDVDRVAKGCVLHLVWRTDASQHDHARVNTSPGFKQAILLYHLEAALYRQP